MTPQSRSQVLVVDDDEFVRALLRRIFEAAGIGVETYASATELLAGADLARPAVLLLDMSMPEMSGLELQSLLRRRAIDLPVIFLTGASDIAMAVAAMRNGAFDFIEKPFDKETLLGIVRRCLAAHVRAAAAPADAVAAAAAVPSVDYARRLRTLTTREREVLDLMITGKTSKMIAQELGGSFRTIEIHRTRVMRKMAAASLAALVHTIYEGTAVA